MWDDPMWDDPMWDDPMWDDPMWDDPMWDDPIWGCRCREVVLSSCTGLDLRGKLIGAASVAVRE
jgi:hypothetical protein